MPTASATTNAAAKSAGSPKLVIDTAKQAGEQILGLYRQSAKFTLDAAGTSVSTIAKVLPGPKLPPTAVSDAMEQMVDVSFQLASDVLSVQQELAAQALASLTAAKRA